MKSKIIEQFEQKIKFTDYVYVTKNENTGELTIRLKNMVLPRGIYTLWLEGTEDIKGYGMLYLGISVTKKQSSRTGVMQRWHSHAFKLTGISFDDPLTGLPARSRRTQDTKRFAEFRKELHLKKYDLPNILDKFYFRFINLEGIGKAKIEAMETRILETRIKKGQCRLNESKRRPCLTPEELKYFDDL